MFGMKTQTSFIASNINKIDNKGYVVKEVIKVKAKASFSMSNQDLLNLWNSK